MKFFLRNIFMFIAAIFGNIFPKDFKAHLAETWYPETKSVLRRVLGDIDYRASYDFNMLMNRDEAGLIRAIIVPHAGYSYSGAVAAAVYRLLDEGSIDTVIILAPSHHVAFNGIAAPRFTKYSFPTGSLDVEVSGVNKLRKNLLFHPVNGVFSQEHSLEMQLPFLHYYLPGVKMIPLIVGDLSEDDFTNAVETLREIINPRTLVVVSSDFTHYGERFHYTPFANNVTLRVRQQASQVLRLIQNNDEIGFKQYVEQTGVTVCGYNPIRLLLKMINHNVFGDKKVMLTRLVAYATSQGLDKTPEGDDFVTYGSLIVKQDSFVREHTIALNQQEKNALLQYARDILKVSFEKNSWDAFNASFEKNVDEELLKPVMTDILQRPSGVFVTLYDVKNGRELRGCVGILEASMPLYQAVAEYARKAAFEDSRFSPLKEDELYATEIEISVLSESRSVKNYQDIILGMHGIVLSVSGRSAVYLPQVPLEQGWTLEKTLSELSKKAGLPGDAWQSKDVRFEVFTTTTFHSETYHDEPEEGFVPLVPGTVS